MFYPSYLGLSPDQATERLDELTNNSVNFGGTFTVNWHDRSVAPERLWTGTYRDLIENLRKEGAWFATAQQAVSWFRKRRALKFEVDSSCLGRARTALALETDQELPGLRCRVHQLDKDDPGTGAISERYVDTQVTQCEPIGANCAVEEQILSPRIAFKERSVEST
jgi:hypothetical protein